MDINKDFFSKFKFFRKYRRWVRIFWGAVITFVILAVILLPLVLVVSHSLDVVGKIKGNYYTKPGIENRNIISVSGEGKVYAKPDIAFIDFSVVIEGEQVKSIQDLNAQKMNQVINFLKSSGINEKDIKTTNYSLYPQYVYADNKAPQIMGYQITQTVSIKIRNLDKVGTILEGVVGVGINHVNSLYFGVENDEQIKEQARKSAIDDAKNKAEKLASQLGVKLVRITGFSESASGHPVPMYDYKGYGVGGGSETPQIQTGENEISVNVNITYEIK